MSKNDDSIEVCSSTVIHEEIVNKVKDQMLADDEIYNISELFKVFGDATRIKIIYALFTAEMCVCDISALLGMNQSAISHQLKILKQSKLVKFRRDGKVIYYSLDDEHVKRIFDQGLIHVREKRD